MLTPAALARTRQDPRLADLARLRATSEMVDAVIDEVRGRHIRIAHHWLIDFASCNYLGFDLDPEIMAAADEQVRQWGTHPSWSRMLGSPRLYREIEEQLTELLLAPDTLVLPTVTLIHMSVVPVLAGQGTVFLEGRSHKTLYDACVYARAEGAQMCRFGIGDLQQLEEQLRASPAGPGRLVCLDGVNSMTGNVPDLRGYAALCRKYDALLYVDDAHGFGVLGERHPDEASPYGTRGNSIVRYLGENYENVILVGGFSKAYSALLAFVALPAVLKDLLKVAAPPYLYSGPSPTSSLAGVLAGFEVNRSRGDAIRQRLYRLTARVLDDARNLGLEVSNVVGTPIVELPLAPGQDLTIAARELWRRGIYVTLAAYPLVPRTEVGIRIQLTAAHSDEDVTELTMALTALAAGGALRKAPPAAVSAA